MKTVDEIVAAVARFVDEHVVPSCKSDLARFRAGFAKPLVLAKVRDFAAGFAVDGRVDVSVLRECVASGFAASKTVKVADFRFDAQDAEKFFSYLGETGEN